jgi:hypothetical protein
LVSHKRDTHERLVIEVGFEWEGEGEGTREWVVKKKRGTG